MTRFARLVLLAPLLVVMTLPALLTGCGPAVGGPRFWWDDQKQTRMPPDYQLPPLPASEAPAPAEEPPAETPPAEEADAPSNKKSTAGAVPKGMEE